MTATDTAPFGFLTGAAAFLRRSMGLFGKALLAFVFILVAGIIAIATAAAGIALACFAVMIRLVGTRQEQTAPDNFADQQGITLEARQTPRGWTVE